MMPVNGGEAQLPASSSFSAAGSRAFSDTLEDFARHDISGMGADQAEDGSVPEDEQPEPDPVISLHPDELERLKDEARQAGYDAGETATGQELSEQMAGAVQQVFAFMEEEESYRTATMMQMAELFVQSVCQTVEQLVSGDLSGTMLGRKLADDAADIVRRCDGPVSLSCSSHDEPALRAALGSMEDVTLHVAEDQPAGHLTVSAAETRMILDRDRWMETVRQRVAEAIQALARSASIEAPSENPRASDEQIAQHEGD